MKELTILIGLAGALAAQTAGSLTGTLKDTAGAAVPGAVVTAYSQTKSTDGKFPPVFNTTTRSDGSFAFSGFAPGTYVLCAERPDVALLNPCLWSGTKTTVSVPATGSAPAAALVAEKGVALTVRVNDAEGLLAANPLLDDLLIGVKPSTGPPLPARLASKDGAGKTLTVFVRQGQPVDVLIYSAKLLLADAKGNALSATNSKVTVTPSAAAAPATSQGAVTPDVSITIQGKSQKP